MRNCETNWLSGRAQLTPSKTALIEADTGMKITYKQLNEHSERLSTWLQRCGITKGDRVALLAPNNIACIEYAMACAKLGAIFVPLNWRLSVQELIVIAEDCTPSLLIYDSSLAASAQQLGSIPRHSPTHPIDWNDEGTNAKTAASVSQTPDRLQANDPWMIIYTGGTTGKPKGVVLSHRSVWGNAVNTIVSWALSPDEVTLTGLPMFHTGGLNALTLPVLLAGGTVVLTKDFHPEQSWKLISQYRCTIVLMVPTMYHRIMQHDAFWNTKFDPVPMFISGGAPCPQAVYDGFARRGYPFKEGYGLTEAGPNNFYISPDEAFIRRGSVGRAMLFNHVRLVGHNGQETAPNEVGELHVCGIHLFHSYWNNESATAEALHDGWLHTGDLGRRDDEGYYYIVGRKKDMIISGGENIYPMEIEQLLDTIPEIQEAAVVGIADETWGEIVVAAICLKPSAVLEAEQLKEHCRQKLARYKVPKRFVFWDSLPKTDVGKINKKEIKRRLQ